MITSFPEGTLEPGQPPREPDFILTTTTSKRVGIELTELFHPNSAKQQSSVKDQVTNKLMEALCDRLPYRFTMNVFIDPVRTIRKSGMNELNDQLAEICIREFASLENNGWGEVERIDFDLTTLDPPIFTRIHEQGYRNLPDGISGIRIHRYDGLPYSYNSKSEGGLVPHLSFSDIESLLSERQVRPVVGLVRKISEVTQRAVG